MKFWRKVTYATVGSVLLVSVVVVYFWANQSQSVVPQAQPTTNQTTAPDTSQLAISTQYYNTVVSGSFRVLQRESKPSDQILDRFIAVSTTFSDKCQLAITIVSLPSDGLQGVADVHYRISNPDLFSKVDLTFAPEGSLVFRGNKPDELDVFMLHGDHYASVALSSTDGGSTKCGDAMPSILDKWHWL